jgi:site-specific DNA-methyltransferase (adenine-specific)
MNVKLSKLKPNPSNPRTVRDEKFIKLKNSIEAFPDMLNKRPIVAVTDKDGKYMVLGGNMRLKACADLGMKEVPVILADEWTEEQRREFIIKDNVGFGEWDWDQLANEWDAGKLDEWGLDLPISFGEETETPEETKEDVIHEVPSNPVTVKGDVWLLGKHRILCGDCRDFNDVEKLLKGAKINVAVTSPPYASQRKYDETSGFKPIPPDEYVEWYRDVAANIIANIAEDGSYFCNIKEHCEDGQRSLYVKDLTLAHVRKWGWMFVDEFCWRDTKNGVPGGWNNRFKDAWEPIFHYAVSSGIKFHPLANGTPSESVFDYSANTKKSSNGSGLKSGAPAGGMKEGIARPSNVVEFAAADGQDGHSAAFPVSLPEFFIKAFSDKGDIIFDPFMGSGTTLIAAEKNGRIGYGTEISPGYCDVIVKRWQDFTGLKAIHEATGRTFEEVAALALETTN